MGQLVIIIGCGYFAFLFLLKKNMKMLCALLAFLLLAGSLMYMHLRENVIHRHYHGICNSGVSYPFESLMKKLGELHSEGHTRQVSVILEEMERDGASKLRDVWLYNKFDSFSSFVDRVLVDQEKAGRGAEGSSGSEEGNP